jgi:hypothetical protein
MSNSITALLGVAFSAGLNVYATVLALGVMHRLEVYHLPDSLAILASTPVLIAAVVLYVVEFVADKIPLVDSVWDGIHTVIRPVAGALLAYGMVGTLEPQWQIIAALAGGGIALTSHAAKASTRAAVNVSPEPFSNWILSLAEDGLVFVVMWLIAAHPIVALVLVLLLIALAVTIVWKFSRFVRRVFRPRG